MAGCIAHLDLNTSNYFRVFSNESRVFDLNFIQQNIPVILNHTECQDYRFVWGRFWCGLCLMLLLFVVTCENYAVPPSFYCRFAYNHV